MIPFTVKIHGKRQIIIARNVIEAKIKAQRLLESRRMLMIPIKPIPLILKKVRRIR